jgi:hypothetical protein
MLARRIATSAREPSMTRGVEPLGHRESCGLACRRLRGLIVHGLTKSEVLIARRPAVVYDHMPELRAQSIAEGYRPCTRCLGQ